MGKKLLELCIKLFLDFPAIRKSATCTIFFFLIIFMCIACFLLVKLTEYWGLQEASM